MIEPALRIPAPTSSGESLRRAIVGTLIDADLFDHALTRGEIHRYLIGQAASAAEVVAMLEDGAELRFDIAQTDDRFHLPGRHRLAKIRRERAAASAGLWPVAKRYGAWLDALPLVPLGGGAGDPAMADTRPTD